MITERAANARPDLSPFVRESLWLNDAPARRRLLVLYPHPDDETFGNAGTIIGYARQGVAVHYGCATKGECGTVSQAHMEGYGSIGELRSAELACAARTLGLAAVHYLGYRDSGMQGAPDNQHPESMLQVPLEQLTGQVVGLIRALKPQVVLTFGPYGGYGHPDHIRLHHAALAAFSAASDPAAYPEQLAAGLEPWFPSKLYYPTFGTFFLRVNIMALRLMGKDPRRFGENKDIDMVRVVEENTATTTVIGCGDAVERKIEAWRCHRSQLGDISKLTRLPGPLRRLALGRERYTRAIPPWSGGPRESDLFAGVKEA